MSSIDEAINFVQRQFPFSAHLGERNTYVTIGQVVLRYLKPESKILDFGSGPCDRTALVARLGYQLSAYDDLRDEWHNENGVKEAIFAFAKELQIDFKLATEGPFPFGKQHFDMLMMHNVLEHLHDSPRNLLIDLLETVKSEGFLFITVPNAVNIRKRLDVLLGNSNLSQYEKYYWSSYPWRGHIREYTQDDLKKMAKYLDLQILELEGCHQMLRKLPKFTRPLYVATTKVFQGWSDSWKLVAKKKPGWSPQTNLSADEWRKILGGKWL